MKKELTPFTGRGSVWDFMSEMEKAFDDIWSDTAQARKSSPPTRQFIPPVDLRETNDFFLISVDVPGMSEKDVQIEVHDGRLTLKGERKFERKTEEQGFQRLERSYGHFERSFQLPKGVNEEKIQARCENGVLEVMIPKAEQAKPRSVSIETGKGNLFSRLMGKETQSTEGDRH